ncbi:hypothetical protein GWK47_015630 [Chionoecetes opilio]|uniref:Uncharacterized protein n=1 Tax=Chionoecetes opilio TaxID=41210 RepID=A0A8J4XSA6_CHIOP|nr:hypothetical protein GWK47_015630 [Chionoecetes opilio]
MVPDSYGKLHPRLIREENVSVTEEPSGRAMRSQSKKVQTAVTFYVRTGVWFAHSECVLSLMASQTEDDRRFAVTQILKLRGRRVWGHPCKTSLHTQAELVHHQLADTDQLAAWPGARAGTHLFSVRGSIQEILVSRTRFRSSLSTLRAPKES